jgi:integrase/recombinase XerD
MTSPNERKFKRNYKKHLQHLKLKGLQPKTIEAYSRAIRRIGTYFEHDIDDLSKQQLTDYFTDLLSTHSWSAVKLDLYGLKFYYAHVLDKPWVNVDLIKPPKAQRLPDIVTEIWTEIWDTHQIATIQALVNTAIQRYSGADSNVGCPDIYADIYDI